MNEVQFDRFGGWRGLQLGPTGFFRTEKADGKWWLVTPEGNAFLSWGGNHVETKPLLGPHNREHWLGKFGVDSPEDPQFLVKLEQKVREDVQKLGWNTLGCHSPVEYYRTPFMPYVQTVRMCEICHYMSPGPADFPDVFSPEFEAHCDRVARGQVLPRAEDPMLIGYSLVDCPVWTDLDARAHDPNIYGFDRPDPLPTWPRALRNLPADAPGKQAWIRCMQDIYRDDIASFNAFYGERFKSFDKLLTATDWRPLTDESNAYELRDNQQFLDLVVDRYYTIACAAIHRHDDNHLILGDKLNGNTCPPDSLLEIAARYVDLWFYQLYAFWPEQEKWMNRLASIADKPLFHGDSNCSLPSPEMPDPFGPHCRDEADRIARSRELLENAFSRPDFVGWNWCGWLDGWQSIQPDKQHSGLQDAFGNFHPVQEIMLDFSSRMYQLNSPS